MLWFRERHGIQIVNRRKEPHAQAVEAAKARFEVQGRWFPATRRNVPRPPGWKDEAEDTAELVALARAHPRKRAAGDPWTMDELRVVIARAFDAMGPGERLNTQRYKALPRADGYPSMFTIAKHAKANGTSFAQMVRDEAARRAHRRRGSDPG